MYFFYARRDDGDDDDDDSSILSVLVQKNLPKIPNSLEPGFFIRSEHQVFQPHRQHPNRARRHRQRNRHGGDHVPVTFQVHVFVLLLVKLLVVVVPKEPRRRIKKKNKKSDGSLGKMR